MNVRELAIFSITLLGIFSAALLLLLSIPNNSLFSFHYVPNLLVGCLLSAVALFATSFYLEAIMATKSTLTFPSKYVHFQPHPVDTSLLEK